MRWNTYLLTFILALGLVACGKEEAPAPETASPAAESAPAEAAPAAAADTPAPAKSSGGGGYEPAENERVPGITVSKEEMEKQTEAALANTPKPEIPADEAPKAE